MSEDFQIQSVNQQQSSAMPYALTGAAIGGVGAGLGAHYITKPKYGSLDDIIEETNDKDKFDKKIADAAEEDKDFLKEAQELAAKKEAAGAEYDQLLEEYKTANAGSGEKKITPEYEALQTAEKEAQTALETAKAAESTAQTTLDAKKAALAAEEIEEKTIQQTQNLSETHKKYYESERARKTRALKDVNQAITDCKKGLEKISEPVYKSMQPLLNDVYNLRANADARHEVYLKNPTAANRTAWKNAEKVVNNYMKKAEEGLNDIVDAMDFGNLKGKALKDAKEKQVKMLKTFIESSVNERIINENTNKDIVKGLVEKNEKAFDTIKDIAKRDLSTESPEKIAQRVQLHIEKVEKPNLEKLQKLQNAYNEAVKAAKDSGSTTTVTREFKGELAKSWFWGNPREITGTLTETTTIGGKDIMTIVKEGLSDKEKEIFDKIVNGKNEAEIKKAFEDAIKQRQQNITRLSGAVADINNVATQFKEMGGEGAYVRKGTLYKADGAKVEFKPKTVKLASGIELPIPGELKALEQQAKNLEDKITELNNKLAPQETEVTRKVKKYTAEQIEKEVENEKQALEAAKKARETAQTASDTAKSAREAAYEKLETAPAKTAEELVEEFHKKHGVDDKNGFIDKRFGEAKESYLKKYAEKVKRKFGFAEHYNWKLAGTILAGATLVGGLFSLFAPKDQA